MVCVDADGAQFVVGGLGGKGSVLSLLPEQTAGRRSTIVIWYALGHFVRDADGNGRQDKVQGFLQRSGNGRIRVHGIPPFRGILGTGVFVVNTVFDFDRYAGIELDTYRRGYGLIRAA